MLLCALCKPDFDVYNCACCSLGCLIKGSNSVLVLDNAQLPYLEAHSTICVYHTLLQTDRFLIMKG